ncbi:PREDICTED: uncharacterized protein LOC106894029 [Calidris pugnax]|uniref:uncharacterized protein LOC106894029 n=1 Tax=Calidris pugnax TaxID=198806 RepID=UPI00071DE2A2|nr:PREDICTED: uncharacterized protein LOC106894029 [Calidris pugnax]
MSLGWICLTLLTPLLAAQQQDSPGTNSPTVLLETEGCQKPQWNKVHFNPKKKNYRLNEEVTLTCSANSLLPLAVIRCAKEMSPGWKNAWEVKDIEGAWQRVVVSLTCPTGRCPKPQWEGGVQFEPNKTFYKLNEETTLKCTGDLQPSFPEVKCARQFLRIDESSGKAAYGDAWWGRNSTGAWIYIEGAVVCVGRCSKPQWDERLQFVPSKNSYEENEELTLNCSGDLEPSYTKVKCAREFLGISSGEAVYGDAWWGTNSTGAWTYIERAVECIETCKRPSWDPRLQLAPDRKNYKKNEEVVLSCPQNFQPSFSHVKCSSEVQSTRGGKSVYREDWRGKDSRGDWIHIQVNVECIEILQVVSEISSTSITLNWTCRLPDACQHMRATCHLALPSSPPCEAEEVQGEEMLQGQEGTFIAGQDQ